MTAGKIEMKIHIHNVVFVFGLNFHQNDIDKKQNLYSINLLR